MSDKRIHPNEATGLLSGQLHLLYRGLKRPYDPERVGGDHGSPIFWTDFTDCPYTALLYATGPKGMLLVLEVPEGARHITEELWPDSSAKRLMVWGRFDDFIVLKLAAKELRAQVRRKGISGASNEHKAYVLRSYIEDRRRAMAAPDREPVGLTG